MAARRYYLSRRARADLDSIAHYLAERNPKAARRVLTELRNTFQLLATSPESGTRRDDLHPNVRLFTPSPPARNFVVFFYPHPDGVEISDIIHAAQDWEGMFDRGER
jgi:plasmid stabilization system protein ParE